MNVSNAPGIQNEPAVAVDPANDRVLLAGSNSFSEGTMRVYSSTDGGATWTSETLTPPAEKPGASCAADPWVAIDRTGRQYFSFLRTVPCATGSPRGRVFVATRYGPSGAWTVPGTPVAELAGAQAHDKPSLAVDTSPESRYEGRVYVAWTRVSRTGLLTILLSHSDDGGATWSRPVRVSDAGRTRRPVETYASVAVGPTGDVYVAWDDIAFRSIRIDRSTDGGDHFGRDRLLARYRFFFFARCGSGIPIPAQLNTCVRSNPIVSVDALRVPYRGRVYVTYSLLNTAATYDVFVAALNRRLRPLLGDPLRDEPHRVTPADGPARSDQFWPASAVDTSTGRLWVCFYDTRGDSRRREAFFSCTASADGGRTFARPVRAASVPSNEAVKGADPRQYGDYQGLAVAGGVAHPVWTDSRQLATLGEEIYTAALTEADLAPR